MKIEKIYPKGFAANTYFVTADGKNAVVVDPADQAFEHESHHGIVVDVTAEQIENVRMFEFGHGSSVRFTP